MVIDIGEPAIDRLSRTGFGTQVNKGNPANATGTITEVKIWAESSMNGCKVGTFYTTNGNTLKCRAVVEIGDVAEGAERTFSELTLAVVAGDYIGMYYDSGGYVERSAFGYNGRLFLTSEDHLIVDDEAVYAIDNDDAVSLYGTGEEIVVGWTGKISGVTNPAKIMGVDVANIAKVKGVA